LADEQNIGKNKVEGLGQINKKREAQFLPIYLKPSTGMIG